MRKLKKVEDMDPDFLPDLVFDRRVGMRTARTSEQELMKYGFSEDVARVLLQSFNKMTAADVRGYRKTPPQLEEWRKRGRKDKSSCTASSSNVETDNK
jgi:hypothetical protein